MIAVACADDGRPLFLWPFEMAPAGMKVLSWLGQDHANYNMGLFAPEAAPKFTANDLSRLLAEVARETGAVAAILRAQPFSWDGMANPFAELPRRPTPSSGYAVTLGDFAAPSGSANAPATRSSVMHASSPRPARSNLAGRRRATKSSRCSTRSLPRSPANSPPWASRTSSTPTPAPSTARSRCSKGTIQAGSGSAI